MAVPRNKSESQALQNFREVVKDLEFSNGILMRFLRARNLNITQAEKMIRLHKKFRTEGECHNHVDWHFPESFIGFSTFLTGFDSAGRLVVYGPFGRWPLFRDLIVSFTFEEFHKSVVKAFENVYTLLLQTRHQQFIVLFDFDGMTVAKLWYEARNIQGIKWVMTLLQEFEANYPETLFKAYLFNVPRTFAWIWKLISSCLNECTQQKIDMFDNTLAQRKECMDTLFSDLPKSCIPVEYGGTSQPISAYEDDCVEHAKMKM